MYRIFRILTPCAVAAIIATTGTGCTSSSQLPAATGAARPTAAVTATSDGGTAKPIKVCDDLTAAMVSRITGGTFTKAEEDDTLPVQQYACNYTGSPGNQLRLSIQAMNGGHSYDLNLGTLGAKATTVTGIGDKAFSNGGPSALIEVLFGDVDYNVSGFTTITVDQAEQLVSAVHDKES